MSRRLKLVVLALVIVLLISSMSILLTSCNEGEQEPKDYGTFYTLQEAYDLGYIDMQDLKSIAYFHNLEVAPSQDDNDYDLIENKNIISLDNNTIVKIKNTWDIQWKKSVPKLNNHISKFEIEHYYGVYNNVVAIVTSIPININNPTAECRQIEGVDIWYENNLQRVLLWVDEKINPYGNYTLQEAYNLGYIDVQGLRSIVFHMGDFEQVKSFEEDFVATPINESELNDELSDMAISSLIKDEQRLRPTVGASTYDIGKYLGIYNDVLVYLVDYTGGGWSLTDVIKIEVDGIMFYVGSPYKIRVYKMN